MAGDGYGVIGIDGKNVYAHRFSYEQSKGPIPPGLVIDHLCRVHHCVNPDHLEAVTTQENIRRGEAAARLKERAGAITHCPMGHAYDDVNTYKNNGKRNCKQCNVAHVRKYQDGNRERINARARAYRAAQKMKKATTQTMDMR